MSKAPAFQMYAADALSDCLEMTNEEMGVYMRLLLSSWVNKSIPSDTSRIARIVAMTESEFLNVWPAIEGKFQPNEEGRLVNPRLEKTRQEQEDFKASKSKAGKAAAEARKKKAELEAANKKAEGNKGSAESQQSNNENPAKLQQEGNTIPTEAQQNANTTGNKISTKSNPSSSPSSSSSKDIKTLCGANEIQLDILTGKPEVLSEAQKTNLACIKVIDHLNEKAGKGFTYADSHKEHIRARFDEGHSLEKIIQVIDLKVADWLTDEEMNKYLQPGTLFNRKKFNNYVGQVGCKPVPKKTDIPIHNESKSARAGFANV